MLAYISNRLVQIISSLIQHADECKAIRHSEKTNHHANHGHRHATSHPLHHNARPDFSEHLLGTGI